MRKGTISKFSMVIGIAAAVGSLSVSAARAELDGALTYIEPAGTLVMPFDATANKVSYQVVTAVPSDEVGSKPIATHWSYWSQDCDHLVDVVVCLTPNDTIALSPKRFLGFPPRTSQSGL